MGSSRKRLVVLIAVAAVVAVILFFVRKGPSSSSLIREAEAGKGDARLDAIRKLAQADSPEAVAAVTRLVHDPETPVAVETVSAVGRTRRPERLPIVRSAVADKRSEVREAAVIAVAQVGGRSTGPELMQVLQGDESADVKAAAADALGRLRYLDSVPLLLDLLEHPSARVRRSAAAAIRRIWTVDHNFKADAPEEERRALVQGIRWRWQMFCQSPAYGYLKANTEKQP